MPVVARKRDSELQAAHFASDWGQTLGRLERFIGEWRCYRFTNSDMETFIVIRGAHGAQTARVGDWIVRDADGRCSVCSAEEFEQTYRILRGKG